MPDTLTCLFYNNMQQNVKAHCSAKDWNQSDFVLQSALELQAS